MNINSLDSFQLNNKNSSLIPEKLPKSDLSNIDSSKQAQVSQKSSKTPAIDMFDLQPRVHVTYNKPSANPIIGIKESSKASVLEDFSLPKSAEAITNNSVSSEVPSLSAADSHTLSDAQFDRFLRSAFRVFDINE